MCPSPKRRRFATGVSDLRLRFMDLKRSTLSSFKRFSRVDIKNEFPTRKMVEGVGDAESLF